MNKKRQLLVVLCLVLASIFGAVSAQVTTIGSGNCGASGNNLTWVLTSDGILTVNGSGAMANYEYEPTIDGSTAPWSVHKDKIKTLVIGNNVTSIGDYAFLNCFNLAGTLTIPNAVTSIGGQAFQSCYSLTSLIIGNAVATIGQSAFNGCRGLAGIATIPNSVSTIGSYAFDGCSGITSLTIGNSVDTIGVRAFRNCSKLATVNFNADSCVYMGYISSSPIIGTTSFVAFQNCSITTLNIGNNVKAIPDYAFSNSCSGVTSVTIPNSVVTIGDYAFRSSGITTLTIPKAVSRIGDFAFNSCLDLKTINFNADSCTYMGRLTTFLGGGGVVFGICEAVSTINIGSNVKIIPDCAFVGLTGLTSVTVPNSVTAIGNNAFQCGITSISIPNSVTFIGNSAFEGCNLTEITIPNAVAYIGDNAFSGCDSLRTVNFNADSCTYMYKAFGSYVLPLVTTLNIGNNVKIIPDNAFSAFSGITSISIPNSVTAIGNGAFSGCGFTTLTIPSSVTYIGNEVFAYCNGLKSVTIPNSVTYIGNSVFAYCNGLTSVTVRNSYINNRTFMGCANLKSVTIGKSVNSIGDYAFYLCSSLATITSEAVSPPAIGGYFSFYGVPKNATVYVPCKSIADYQADAVWGTFTNIVETGFVYGCTDPKSLNYNPDATDSDNSCVYANEENIFETEITVTPVDIVGARPQEDCRLIAGLKITSATITGITPISGKKIIVHWKIVQDDNIVIYDVEYTVTKEGVNLFYLSIICKEGAVRAKSLRSGTDENTDVIGYTVSATFNVENLPSSINQPKETSNLVVYPNPTTGIVNIGQQAEIKVYSLQGTLLQETFGTQVNLSAYPQGVYQLQENGQTVKVVKK